MARPPSVDDEQHGESGPSSFVGRERELTEVRRGFDEIPGGHGKLFVFTGEPGIGKTRLATEIVAGRPAGFEAHWGRCWDGIDSPAFWPWIEVFQSLLRGLPDEEMARLRDGPGRSLSAFLPPLRSSGGSGPQVALGDRQADEHEFRVFDAGLEILRGRAQVNPVVVVLDDLHAADPMSLRMLLFVARSLPSLPICILATARDREARILPAVADLMPRVAREGTRLPLVGLQGAEISEVVRNRAGFSPDPSVLTRLRESTGGNPFLLDETIRLLVAEGTLQEGKPLDVEATPLPEGARDVLSRTFDLLSGTHRGILRAAAILGPEFDASLLSHIVAPHEAEVGAALQRAQWLGLVAPTPDEPDRFRFVHDLVVTTLLAECDRSWAAQTHLKTADRLENLYASDPEPHLGRLAHHFVAALPAGAGDRAVHYATRAAHAASDKMHADETAAWARRALSCLERVGDQPTQRSSMMLLLGFAQRWTGDVEGARATLTEVARRAENLGDGPLLAHAALGASHTRVETGLVDQEIVGLLERALAALPEDEASLRTQIQARLSTTLYFDARWGEGRSLAEAALASARREEDPLLLGYALAALQLALWRPDTLSERAALADETLRCGEESGHPPTLYEAHNWRIVAYLERGDVDAVDAEIDRLSVRFQRLRYERARGYIQLFRTMRELMCGRLDDVEAKIMEILGGSDRSPDQDGLLQVAGTQLYFLRLERGRIGELEGTVRQLAERFPVLKSWRAGLAQILFETGRLDEAREEIASLAPSNFAAVRRDGNWMMTIAALSEVAAGLGAVEHARVLYDLLLPFGDRNVVTGLGWACYGSTSRYLGMLAAAIGDHDRAIRHLDAALGSDAASQANPFVAWSRLHLARSLAATGRDTDAERAGEMHRDALRMADGLGLTRLLTRADDFALASGRTGSPRTAEPRADVLLFQRVGGVWRVGAVDAPLELKHAQGFAYIHRLLGDPTAETTAVSLYYDGRPPADLDRPAREDASLDPQVRRDDQAQVRSLREEIAAAEADNDTFRAAGLRDRLDEISDRLAAASGLGSADRAARPAAERARLNVTRAIRSALSRIEEYDAPLADHLGRRIRTGRLCSYEPDPVAPIDWRL